MAYGLTQSINFVAASTQRAGRSSEAILQITGAISVEAWVKFSSIGGALNQAIISKYDAGNDRNYLFDMDSLDLRFIVGNAGVFSLVARTGTFTTGVWYHLAGTLDPVAQEMKVYVNGVQLGATATGQGTTPGAGAASLFIAGRGTNGLTSNLDGEVSLARLWSSTRSVSDISSNMCNVLGSTTNLVGEWTFDNTYNDNSGNTQTLTGFGTPTFTADVPALCVPAINTGAFFNFM